MYLGCLLGGHLQILFLSWMNWYAAASMTALSQSLLHLNPGKHWEPPPYYKDDHICSHTILITSPRQSSWFPTYLALFAGSMADFKALIFVVAFVVHIQPIRHSNKKPFRRCLTSDERLTFSKFRFDGITTRRTYPQHTNLFWRSLNWSIDPRQSSKKPQVQRRMILICHQWTCTSGYLVIPATTQIVWRKMGCCLLQPGVPRQYFRRNQLQHHLIQAQEQAYFKSQLIARSQIIGHHIR